LNCLEIAVLMISEKEGTLYSLILNCPFELGCSDCPFDNIRKIEILERINHLRKMDNMEVEKMLSKHYENYKTNFNCENFRN